MRIIQLSSVLTKMHYYSNPVHTDKLGMSYVMLTGTNLMVVECTYNIFSPLNQLLYEIARKMFWEIFLAMQAVHEMPHLTCIQKGSNNC